MKKASLFLAAVFSLCTLALFGCGQRDHGDQIKSDAKEIANDTGRAVSDAGRNVKQAVQDATD